jgi:hypothetical protein
LYIKPAIVFDGGKVREFGTGRKDATVFPLWWWMIILAIVSYLIVHFGMNMS